MNFDLRTINSEISNMEKKKFTIEQIIVIPVSNIRYIGNRKSKSGNLRVDCTQIEIHKCPVIIFICQK